MAAKKAHTPRYQAKLNVHLPAHKPWREENVNLKRIIEGSDPFEFLIGTITDTIGVLGMQGDPNLLIGLFLNIINPAPASLRQAIAGGIYRGMGMKIETGANGEILGSIEEKFPPLKKDIAIPNGEKRTESGIIIP
jgi:hypothetical protein